jgi:cytochrome P450
MLMREVSTDTVLTLPRQGNPDKLDQIPLKKGTEIVMDYISLGYDEQSFPDSDKFDPFRWAKSSRRTTADDDSLERARKNEAPIPTNTAAASTLEGFVGFSFGPRTCLGHKFAKVEAVAFLTCLLKEWRVEVYLKEGETREEWRARMMDPKIQIALAVGKVPLRLVRREKRGGT